MSDPVYSYSTNRYYPAGTSGGYYDPVTQQCVLEEESANPKPASVPAQETSKPSGWSAKKILAYLFYTGRSQGTSGCGYIAEKILNKPGEKDGGVPDKGPEDAKPDIPADVRVDITPKDIGSEIRPDAGPDAAPDAKPDVIQDGPKPDVIKDIPQPDKALDGPKPDIKSDTVAPDITPKPDAPVCTVGTPVSMTETDFKVVSSVSTLTNLDHYSLLGGLILEREWTKYWLADDGVLPTWTLTPSNAISLGMVSWANDLASLGLKVLNLNSLTCTGCPPKPDAGPPPGADQTLFYEISPGFTSAGGVVQVTWRRLAGETSGTYGCETSVEIADGVNKYRPGMTATGIEDILSIDPLTSKYLSFTQDTTTKLFTLRIEFKGGTVRYFVNEKGPKVATSSTTTGYNWIRLTDNCGNYDGQAYKRAVAYYNVSDHVPFKMSGGPFTRIFDFGGPVSSFKNITFNGNVPSSPFPTSVTFTTKCGNTPTPDVTWTSELPTTGTGLSRTISPLCNGYRYIQFLLYMATTDSSDSPTMEDVTVNACK